MQEAFQPLQISDHATPQSPSALYFSNLWNATCFSQCDQCQLQSITYSIPARMMSFHVRRNALRSISALSSLTRLQLSLVHRLSAFSSTSDSAHLSGTLSDTKRTYATRHASRPKAHTGRTTSPTRTRKAATALPSTSTSSTEKSDAKPKSSKTKKVQAKSGRKPKRELSENGKIRAEKRKKTELRQELKKIALSPPKKLPESVWSIVMQELVPGAKGLVTKEASSKYKSLSTAELEVSEEIRVTNHRSPPSSTTTTSRIRTRLPMP